MSIPRQSIRRSGATLAAAVAVIALLGACAQDSVKDKTPSGTAADSEAGIEEAMDASRPGRADHGVPRGAGAVGPRRPGGQERAHRRARRPDPGHPRRGRRPRGRAEGGRRDQQDLRRQVQPDRRRRLPQDGRGPGRRRGRRALRRLRDGRHRLRRARRQGRQGPPRRRGAQRRPHVRRHLAFYDNTGRVDALYEAMAASAVANGGAARKAAVAQADGLDHDAKCQRQGHREGQGAVPDLRRRHRPSSPPPTWTSCPRQSAPRWSRTRTPTCSSCRWTASCRPPSRACRAPASADKVKVISVQLRPRRAPADQGRPAGLGPRHPGASTRAGSTPTG